MAPMDFPPSGYVGDYVAFWGIWLVLAAAAFAFVRAARRARPQGAGPGRLRLLAGNALVAAALLWTAVVAAETWLRFVHDASDSYGLTLTNHAWFRRHVRPNSRGFRDAEFAPQKPAGVVRVACVGDSFTLGYGVAEAHDAYPQRLHAALATAFPGRFQVWNMGLVGHDTPQEADLAGQLRSAYDVDHVILGYCLNDVGDLIPEDRQFFRDQAPRPPLVAPYRSFLLDFLWFRMVLARDPRVRGYFDWVREAYDDPVARAEQKRRLSRLRDVCRRDQVRLTVAVFPMFAEWGPGYRLHGCHATVDETLRELGVDAIDLRFAYEGHAAAELVVNRFDAHPNAFAHGIAAKVLLARIWNVVR
jgi:lysophospholipase L1-like esterase